jgi:hypothetical protein
MRGTFFPRAINFFWPPWRDVMLGRDKFFIFLCQEFTDDLN